MKERFRNIGFYFGVIGILGAIMYFIISLGGKMESVGIMRGASSVFSQWGEVFGEVQSNFGHPLTLLLAQIILIIIVARLFGFLCKKIRLPVVIGEIFAGIFLGPSLAGLYFPEFFAAIFPPESLGNLNVLSQIGLVLFMFMVGMELDFSVLNKRAQSAVIISHTGIALSFTLGILLAYFLFESFAPEGVRFQSFALFLGISVSITAFPVLARIMQEKGINKTRLGVFAITCAAVDDITAWSLLAIVITVVKAGSLLSSAYAIILSIGYVIVMLKLVRPFLSRLGELHSSRENLTKPVVAIFFLVLLASAFATEIIGIHAIFGGFMAGVIMPENARFRNIFIDKVEDVALVMLLPLFFVYTGLRTQIGLLNDIALWQVAIVVILVAISGKMVGVTLASRFTGQSWRDSLTLGTLMNTRGLVELVVLNIGYDLGVLSPEIFAMLVIMALVTTLMTSPLLDAVQWIFRGKKAPAFETEAAVRKFKILLSFANPERGRTLLRIASVLLRNQAEKSSVTALHLTPADELFRYNVDDYERESFLPVFEESQKLTLPITTLFKVSADIESDIVEVAQKGEFNLLLVGVGQSIYEGTLLGKVLGFTARMINPAAIFRKPKREGIPSRHSVFDERIRTIVSKCQIPVGILIDKNKPGVNRILVFIYEETDSFLMKYIGRMLHAPGVSLSLLDTYGYLNRDQEVRSQIRQMVKEYPDNVQLLTNKALSKEFLANYDLMVLSTSTWAVLTDMEPGWLYDIPSAIIFTS